MHVLCPLAALRADVVESLLSIDQCVLPGGIRSAGRRWCWGRRACSARILLLLRCRPESRAGRWGWAPFGARDTSDRLVYHR